MTTDRFIRGGSPGLSRRAFGVGLLGAGVIGAIGLPTSGRTVPSVKVVGFGGAGGKVIAAMIRSGIAGVDYVAVDTDADALRGALASTTVHIAPVLLAVATGKRTADFGQARPADHPDRGRLAEALAGADLVVLVGGLSTGTGSGVAVLVADVAREVGAVVAAVVTYEGGNARGRQTAHGVQGLTALGVPIVAWPMKRLLACHRVPLEFMEEEQVDAILALADHQLGVTARALADLTPSFLDPMRFAFASRPGLAFAGTSSARVEEFDGDVALGRGAAERAICTPLVNLEAMVATAPWIVVNVACPRGFDQAVEGALAEVRRLAPRKSKVVFGVTRDDALMDEVRVTVIAGGASARSERWWWARRRREDEGRHDVG